MIRVGIAGIGFMGWIHWLVYQRIRGARVAAICDENPRRLTGDWRDIKGNFGPPGEKVDLKGVATYQHVEDMLANPELDLIDVALPPALHTKVATAALAAGKHVFCEKPLALTGRDCDRAVAAADRAKRHLLVGHVLPFFPEYAWALKTATGGKFGQLLGGSFKRVVADPAWLADYWSPEIIGGPMLDLHVHDAHFIRLMFGMPSAVTTHGRLRGELAEHWNTHFEFDGGQLSVHATGGAISQQGRSFCHAFEIHFQRATLMFEFAVIGDKASYLCPPTLLDERGRATNPKLSEGDPVDAFEAEIRNVVSCVRTQQDSPILNAALARDAIVLCNKQTESLRNGRRVKVSG